MGSTTYGQLVRQYFNKRRSAAAGAANTCLSVGTFLSPPVVDILIQYYSWRGVLGLLIHCAILLNGLVLGALMRPFSETDRQQVHNDSSKNSTVDENDTKHEIDSADHNQEKEIYSSEFGSQPKGSCLAIMDTWSSLLGIPVLRGRSFLFFCIAEFWMQIDHFGILSFCLFVLWNNRARRQLERISDVYILPTPRHQRAAQATTIAPR